MGGEHQGDRANFPKGTRQKNVRKLAIRTARRYVGPQQTYFRRLFTKNLGPCEPFLECIGADACPVLEGYGEDWLRRKSEKVWT